MIIVALTFILFISSTNLVTHAENTDNKDVEETTYDSNEQETTTKLTASKLNINKTEELDQNDAQIEIPLSEKWQKFTESVAEEKNIDVDIIYTIMFHESRFNPNAINYNNDGSVDIGICQINSVNWGWLKKEGINVHTLQGNIRACALILSIFFEKGYTVEEVFAAYAGGEGGMNSRHARNASKRFMTILENQEVFTDEVRWVELSAQM